MMWNATVAAQYLIWMKSLREARAMFGGRVQMIQNGVACRLVMLAFADDLELMIESSENLKIRIDFLQ